MVTLEQTLDSFNELSPEEQNMLTEIIFKRTIESNRETIAKKADESMKEYYAGAYSPLTASEAIDILHLSMKED